MKDLVPMVVIPAVIYGIYAILELYARKKERMAIIEKISEGQLSYPSGNGCTLPCISSSIWRNRLDSCILC